MHKHIYLYLQYSSQCSMSLLPTVGHMYCERYHVKVESFHANEGLSQSFFPSAKPKKAAGKESHTCFCFVDETKAGTFGSSPLFTC